MYGRDAARGLSPGTMAAKAVIRDVGRVPGHPYEYHRISKLSRPIRHDAGKKP